MVLEGQLLKLRGNRYAVPEKRRGVTGRLSINPSGFGFLIPDSDEPDLYVSADNIGNASHGDRVVAGFVRQHRKGPEGRIIRVLERSNPVLVGIFRRSGRFEFVEPYDPRHLHPVTLPKGSTGALVPGQQVVVRIDKWPVGHRIAEGSVIEVLGDPEDPEIDTLTVIRSHGLSLVFPPPVQLEVDRLNDEIPLEEIDRRTDLRDLPCVTIDPHDAQDHDDALSLEVCSDGTYRVGVHIADVSHYVPQGSALDLEARLRGTSIYLVDQVIPMLPEQLSNNICSLKSCEDRLAISVFLNLSDRGELGRVEFVKSIVRVRWHRNYHEIQEIIGGDSVEKDKTLVKMVRDIERIRQSLTAARAERGAIDFQIPEAQVVLDRKGVPIDIEHRLRLPSHRLVEEFMLMANQCVAGRFVDSEVPTLFRVHEKPDPSDLSEFARISDAFGHKFPKRTSPKEIQKYVSRVEGSRTGGVLNTLLLRMMKKATYTPDNAGHFGLASKAYTHFTSPIRRYPDLLVHRLLKTLLWKEDGPTTEKPIRLAEFGKHATEREISARDAENDSVKIKQIRFLENRKEKSFEATIVGIRPTGITAELDHHLIQGGIAVRNLQDDYYRYTEKDLALVGQRKGRILRLGDRITVGIGEVNRRTRQIDFTLIRGGTTHRKLQDTSSAHGKNRGRRNRRPVARRNR
jgi:ribonuclease R